MFGTVPTVALEGDCVPSHFTEALTPPKRRMGRHARPLEGM